MKKLGALMAMAVAMGAFGGMPLTSGGEFIPTETDTERKNRLAIADANRNRANGLLEFKYKYGLIYESVWAINKKNADKKAKKLGYI
jgi:hypothetical protein